MNPGNGASRRVNLAAKHTKPEFFYLFTCEYCFSHYAALFFLVLSGYHLLFDDWRGYLIGWLSLVWIANVYMSVFALLRLDIKRDRVELAVAEEGIEHRPRRTPRFRRLDNTRTDVPPEKAAAPRISGRRKSHLRARRPC